MSKGSDRRPGDGYEDNWEKIFGKKPALPNEKPEKQKTDDQK